MGLPNVELYAARFLFGLQYLMTSQKKASERFDYEAREILALTSRFSEPLASKRVLIDRLPGLEDSSRYWSLYMTMEHLNMVNRFTIDVIKSLLHGERPEVVVSTASVKPKVDAGQGVVPLFQLLSAEFQVLSFAGGYAHKKVTLAHPWFGELNAQQWHFFAAFHMKVHRKQIVKIAQKLDVGLGGAD